MTTLRIKQGATYSFGFTWRHLLPDGNAGAPISLTGCAARMQIRKKAGEAVLVNATSQTPADEAAIAAGAGRIVLEGGDGSRPGHVQVTLTDLDTMGLTIKAGVFDLEIVWPIKPGELRPRVDRPLQGAVEVDPNTTVG